MVGSKIGIIASFVASRHALGGGAPAADAAAGSIVEQIATTEHATTTRHTTL